MNEVAVIDERIREWRGVLVVVGGRMRGSLSSDSQAWGSMMANGRPSLFVSVMIFAAEDGTVLCAECVRTCTRQS